MWRIQISTTDFYKYLSKLNYSYERTCNDGVWTDWVPTETIKSVPTLQNGWVEYIANQNFIYKIKNMVHINLGIKSGTAKQVLTLPEELRPQALRYYPCVNLSKATGTVCSVSPEGVLSVETGDAGSDIFINISYNV